MDIDKFDSDKRGWWIKEILYNEGTLNVLQKLFFSNMKELLLINI